MTTYKIYVHIVTCWYVVAQYRSVTTTGVWHLNNHVRLYADCCMSERARQETYSCSVIIFQILLSALHCGRLHLIAKYVIHLIIGVNIIWINGVYISNWWIIFCKWRKAVTQFCIIFLSILLISNSMISCSISEKLALVNFSKTTNNTLKNPLFFYCFFQNWTRNHAITYTNVSKFYNG